MLGGATTIATLLDLVDARTGAGAVAGAFICIYFDVLTGDLEREAFRAEGFVTGAFTIALFTTDALTEAVFVAIT